MHPDESPPLSLQIPALSDTLAATLYELLQELLDQYEACYFHQIRRYHDERQRQHRKLQAQMYFERSQYPLPFGDLDNF